MWLLAPESWLNLVPMKAADFTPGLMLKILHFSNSVYSRPLIHPLSWSWISCTRFMDWTFLQVLDQCRRYRKNPVSICHLWQEFELLSYSFSLNFLTTLFFPKQNLFMHWWIVSVAFEQRTWRCCFFMTPSWSLFSPNHRIFFNILTVLVTFFLFCNEVSKYSSQERWQEIRSEYKCETNARDNWRVRIWFMWDNCMCWVWCEKVNAICCYKNGVRSSEAFIMQ